MQCGGIGKSAQATSLEERQSLRTVNLLDRGARGDLPKRRVTKELDVPRRTGRRLGEERAELYGLYTISCDIDRLRVALSDARLTSDGGQDLDTSSLAV